MDAMATTALITNPVLIFFIVLVIILFAPLLLNRIRVPHIVGLIVAGVAVGHSGLIFWNVTAVLLSSVRWACST